MPVSVPQMPSKTGGKRRKTRGGNVLAQAIVPASLILMNNALKKRGGNANASMPGTMPGTMPQQMPSNTGGKRRRTRGGNVVAQAIVPASLILMNNALGKHSRKRRH